MPLSERILRWLSVRPSWSEFGRLLGNLFMLEIAWSAFVLLILKTTLGVIGDASGSTEVLRTELERSIADGPVRFLCILALVVFTEEVLFRFIPLSAVLLFAWIRARWIYAVFPVMFIASAVFGLIHLGNHDDVTAEAVISVLLLQGVSGIGLSILFLKYAGLRLRYVFVALMATTTSHILWNSFAMMPMIVYVLLLQ